MAKLSAHPPALLRISRAQNVTDPSRAVVWERDSQAYLGDGVRLDKCDRRWTGETRTQTDGWKRRGTGKGQVSPLVRAASALLAAQAQGWVVEHVEPQVVDAARDLQVLRDRNRQAGA